MAFYRAERFAARSRLEDVVVLPGHRPLGALPARGEIHEELQARRGRVPPGRR
jgi:hypothetical protein